jgi:hypothetical protein
VLGHMLATTDIIIGGFKWKGEFTAIDLIAASTNALNRGLLQVRELGVPVDDSAAT